MDNTIGKRDGDGTHIWLRHAVQFTVGERTHTIEMEVPVPIGASTEEWERLLREAEARMQQLTSRVEGSTGQNTQRNAPAQGVVSPSPSPAKPAVVPSVNKAATSPAAPTMPASVPAPATPPTREVTQTPSSGRREGTPPLRTSIGASLPSTTAIPGDNGDSLKLPQFIQHVKEAMGLTPKQAMELLNVKTLSGLNYRDAIEQLQQLVNRDAGTMPLPAQPSQVANEEGSSKPEDKGQSVPNSVEESEEDEVAMSPSPSPLLPPFATSNSKHAEIKEIQHAVVREVPPAYFDEEDDFGLDIVEEAQEPLALSVRERATAENVLSRLREARGSAVASDTRLKVLKNVVGDQLSNEQLLELIQGVWSVAGLKKLKNDQVEALISWAKEDEFVNEAEVVLAVLQEDEYARSDR